MMSPNIVQDLQQFEHRKVMGELSHFIAHGCWKVKHPGTCAVAVQVPYLLGQEIYNKYSLVKGSLYSSVGSVHSKMTKMLIV